MPPARDQPLRGVVVDRPNHVRCAEITYVPMQHGFMDLVAVMGGYSRKVLSWALSNTLDTDFCVAALEAALHRYGTPMIFNTDQGSQFTGKKFTVTLERKGIRISTDGRGRFHNNFFIERLWWTVKYRCPYLNEFENGLELRTALRGAGSYCTTKKGLIKPRKAKPLMRSIKKAGRLPDASHSGHDL